MHRVHQLSSQITAAATVQDRSTTHSRLRWNGWGYDDTRFQLNHAGQVEISGNRYLYSGKVLPNVRPWFEAVLGLNINDTSPAQSTMTVPPALLNEAFVQTLKHKCNGMKISWSDIDRIDHAHGHSMHDIYILRYGKFDRVPDAVVFPRSHAEVEAIVATAVENNVVLIPYGGGTTVTHALECPKGEKRSIVSVDMHLMNKIRWIDFESMEACIEAGAVGVDIERMLNEKGLCLGHEPDSNEFSTLGGWISTRASGMKKNRYGNIEDIVLQIRIVTPKGSLVKPCHGPRSSTGPDVYQFIMGSEGTLGIITEAIVKVHPAPEVREYGSIVFPDFESGVQFMREVGVRRIAPASVRLVDNVQFIFGQTLKPANDRWQDDLLDKVKKAYLTNIKGFELDRMCAVTLLFEGERSSVISQQRAILDLAKKYQGISGGPDNGRRGYFLTYMIAYIRDLGLEYRFLSESFETSVPWKDVSKLCMRVKKRIVDSCKEKGFKTEPFSSCRVTQVYDTGACVYFYFGVKWDGVENPAQKFAELEEEAREEVLACGGSLSHHHGVGKLRKKWMPETVSPLGMEMLRSVKNAVDPQNIFANGNLL